MAKISKSVFWIIIFASALFIAIQSSAYIYAPLSEVRLKPDDGEALAFRLHGLGGILALVFGPLQFIGYLRRNHAIVHHWIGGLYVVAVAIGATGAVIMAANPIGNEANSFAFYMLAALWVLSTAQGFRFALQRNFTEHKKWMLRSYALTFAAVTLRFGIGGLIFGLSFPEAAAYTVVAWASWTINLIILEWFLLPALMRRSAK